ncbi:MAG: PKD domain-containing protein [Candidatus Cyclobacteriaceae bacterium M3_2C_046]
MNRKYFYILPFMLLYKAYSVQAQTDLYIKDLTISNQSSISIQGSLIFDSPQNILRNTGLIILKDSFINLTPTSVFSDGLGIFESGRVKFTGMKDQVILSDSSIFFHKILVEKPAGELVMQGNMRISDVLKLQKGNLWLNNHRIQLYKDAVYAGGSISGESNENRIYDRSDGIGSIVFRDSAIVLNESDYGNIGLGISSPETAEHIELIRKHSQQGDLNLNAGPGDGSIDRLFEFNASENLRQIRLNQLYLKYFDKEITRPNYKEDELTIYLSKDQGKHWSKEWERFKRFTPDDSLVIYDQILEEIHNIFTIAPEDCTNPPPIRFSRDTINLCEGDSVLLDPGVEGLVYLWSNAETSPRQIVKKSGVYQLTVWDSKGCINMDSVTVISRPLPQVILQPVTPVCAGDTIRFKNDSKIEPGNMDSLLFEWQLNDPDKPFIRSNEKNPVYVYTEGGKYHPSVTAISTYGCTASKTTTVDVLKNPVADFSIKNTCLGQPLVIENLSETDYEVVSYQWMIDHNIFSHKFSPACLIEKEGKSSLTLVVKQEICYDTVTKNVEIYPLPELQVSLADSVCQNDLLPIQNSTPSTENQGFFWNFGNGKSSNQFHPQAIYQEPGRFKVDVSINNGYGCTRKDSFEVQVIPVPEVIFTSTNHVCAGNPVRLEVIKPIETTHTFLWDLDQVQITHQTSLTHTFSQPGQHEVFLKVTNEFGCAGSATHTVTVEPNPSANFEFLNACQNEDLSLNNLSALSHGTLNHFWKFSDGSFSQKQNPNKSFEAPGKFEIKLTTSSRFGCVDSVTKQVEIFHQPQLNFGQVVETCGNSLTLSVPDQKDLLSVIWSDGSTQLSNDFTSSGSYWVKVESENFCTSKEAFQVNLKTSITPSLEVQQPICDSVILDAGYPGSAYEWSDGSQNRFKLVSKSGRYAVKIIDQNGCSGESAVNVHLYSTPTVDLGPDLSICTNDQIRLNAGGPKWHYKWSTGETTPEIKVSSSGVYAVEVKNQAGCKTSDYININLHPQPEIKIADIIEGCGSATLAAETGFASYYWSTGDTTRTITIDHSAEIVLEVIDFNGCRSRKNIETRVYPIPFFDLGPNQSACFEQSVYVSTHFNEFHNKSFLWSDGDTGFDKIISDAGIYTLQVTTDQGCTYQDSVAVEIYPDLFSDLPEEKTICTGQDGFIKVSENLANYQWYLNDSLMTDFNGKNQIPVDIAGWYKILAENEVGCFEQDSIRIFETTNVIQADFLVNSLAHIGDTLEFIQLTQPKPDWYQWSFGNGVIKYDYHPKYVYFIPGTYEVALIASNEVCLDTVNKSIIIESLKEVVQDQVFQHMPDLTLELLNYQVYPNPTAKQLAIQVELNQDCQITGGIYNLNGICVMKIDFEGHSFYKNLNLNDLPAGMYLLRLNIGHQLNKQVKIIKL